MLKDDNFLSDNEISDIENRVINGIDIPWTLAYNTDIHNGRESIDSNSQESYQFAAGLQPQMPAYNYFMNVFNKFAEKNLISYSRVIRIKLNWLPRSPGFEDGGWHMPHVDYDQEHRVFLYYINDSDGDTFFFNERYPYLSEGSVVTVKERISPKAGRGVVFDGFMYHASSSPIKNQYRCILNVDFI